MEKYKFKMFMTFYRAAIKSYIKTIQEIGAQFILYDDDFQQIETLNRWITEYYEKFCYLFHRDDISKAEFLKMFS